MAWYPGCQTHYPLLGVSNGDVTDTNRMPGTPQLWHLPFIQPAKGCLYCLDGTPAAADPKRWPPSTALLQPEPGAPGSDLRLIHANVEEARFDCKSFFFIVFLGGSLGARLEL